MTTNRTELHRVEIDNAALSGAGLPVVVVSGGGGGIGGDASAAKQDIGNASLASLDAKTPALSGGRVPVELPAGGGGLTDAELRATPVPVSGAVTTGGLTDAQLRATAVPVSGPLTDAQVRATPLPVSGTVALDGPSLAALESITVVDGGGSLTVDGTVALDAASLAALETIQVGSSALPAGAATDARQDTGNASLASIDGKLANPLPVTGPLTDTQLRAVPVPVSATSLPLPTGAATAARQDTGNTSVASIDTKTPADPAREGGNLATLTAKDFATTAKQDAALTALTLLDTDLKAELGAISSSPGAYTVLDRLNQIGLKLDTANRVQASEATLLKVLAALKPVPCASSVRSTLLHR